MVGGKVRLCPFLLPPLNDYENGRTRTSNGTSQENG